MQAEQTKVKEDLLSKHNALQDKFDKYCLSFGKETKDNFTDVNKKISDLSEYVNTFKKNSNDDSE